MNRIHFLSLFLISLLLTAGHSNSWVAKLTNIPAELPAQQCDEAQDIGLEYSRSIPRPPKAPAPLPFPEITEVLRPKALPKLSNREQYPQTFLPQDLSLQPFDGYPEDIAKVGEIIRRADQNERVRISVFGASHTGGDYWTGHIRRVLQARYGDIGHGFTMPVPLYSGARGSDINLCASDEWVRDYVGRKDGHDDDLLGLGMSVSSEDPTQFTWLETTHSNPIGRDVSIFKILSLGQFGGGSFLAQIDRSAPLLIPTHNESPDLLQTRIEVEQGGHRLTISPTGDGEIRLFGVSVETEGPGVLVDSIGIRGREARTWLSWDEALFQKAIHTLSPDLVILAYGTNEANDSDYTMDNYRKDLRGVLYKLRRANSEAACILVGPSDRGVAEKNDRYRVWDRTQLVAQVQRDVAPEFDCVFWDWQQATGGEGSMVAWRFTDPPLAGRDLIHFSANGYVHSAELFLAALDDASLHYRKPARKPFFRLKR
jgi:lysophospholipase L1-like esterase